MATETVTSRPIYVEDLATTNIPGTTQAGVAVWGGGTQTLTKIPITLLTQLVSAASDVAAAAAGVGIGEIYFLNTTNKLRTRMT